MYIYILAVITRVLPVNCRLSTERARNKGKSKKLNLLFLIILITSARAIPNEKKHTNAISILFFIVLLDFRIITLSNVYIFLL